MIWIYEYSLDSALPFVGESWSWRGLSHKLGWSWRRLVRVRWKGLYQCTPDICSLLSPIRSMSCVTPSLQVDPKPEITKLLFVFTPALIEEDEHSNEPDQAGVSTKLLGVTSAVSRHNHEAIRSVVTDANTSCQFFPPFNRAVLLSVYLLATPRVLAVWGW